jgi:hypothetical protein
MRWFDGSHRTLGGNGSVGFGWSSFDAMATTSAAINSESSITCHATKVLSARAVVSFVNDIRTGDRTGRIGFGGRGLSGRGRDRGFGGRGLDGGLDGTFDRSDSGDTWVATTTTSSNLEWNSALFANKVEDASAVARNVSDTRTRWTNDGWSTQRFGLLFGIRDVYQ